MLKYQLYNPSFHFNLGLAIHVSTSCLWRQLRINMEYQPISQRSRPDGGNQWWDRRSLGRTKSRVIAVGHAQASRAAAEAKQRVSRATFNCESLRKRFTASSCRGMTVGVTSGPRLAMAASRPCFCPQSIWPGPSPQSVWTVSADRIVSALAHLDTGLSTVSWILW